MRHARGDKTKTREERVKKGEKRRERKDKRLGDVLLNRRHDTEGA